jgi:signal peptidase II
MTKRAATALIAAIALADQALKWWVTTRLLADAPTPPWAWLLTPPVPPEGAQVALAPFVDLTMVLNRGVSFGLLSGYANAFLPLALSAATLVIIGALSVWLARTASRLQGAALALIIGGALGNLVDRLRLGHVIDFVDIHAGGWHWPAFNLADAAIVVGVGLVLLHALRGGDKI